MLTSIRSHSFAAAQRPAILVPGANHTQTAFPPPPPPTAAAAGGGGGGRGDLRAAVDDESAVDGFATAIANFLTANGGGGVGAEARGTAAGALVAACGETARMVGPWIEAAGMWLLVYVRAAGRVTVLVMRGEATGACTHWFL